MRELLTQVPVMNTLAPDVSLVGKITQMEFPAGPTLMHIAAGNHDFDFGTLGKPRSVLHILKKDLQDILISAHLSKTPSLWVITLTWIRAYPDMSLGALCSRGF